jgi:hypothetical protein
MYLIGNQNYYIWSTYSFENQTEPNRTEKNQVKLGKNQAKTEKPEPNRKTEPNRFEPVFVQKTEPNQNRSIWTGFGFLKKNRFDYFFFIKTEPNRK